MNPSEEFHFPQNNNLATNFMILLPCALALFCLWMSCRIWTHSLTYPSNAVSRRRKFFRDPIRRPFFVHHRPSTPSFQTTETNESLEFTPRKKLTARGEEFLIMPGGRRNISRTGAGRPQPPTLPNDEAHKKIMAPRHIPMPTIPHDGNIFFEVIMFVFTGMASSLQFLHLYRTVWWLPQSYTRYTMNFYLIDPYLVGFIGTILARRLIYCILAKFISHWSSSSVWPILQQMLRLFLLSIVMLSLIFCTYNIMKNHPIVNIFYLCYPISVYFILFGLSISPFFDVNALPPINKESNNTRIIFGKPLHNCSMSPQVIREEVESLKTDFNNRMKQVLFSSVLNAYYAGFVPCCFAQNYLHYDIYWATQHLVFVWLGCFTMYIVHCYPVKYCDVLHRAALHLGRWARIEGRNSHLPTHVWGESTLWHQGALVKHCKELYKAEGVSNAAEPGNQTHARFYAVFNNPTILILSLLGLQLSLVLVQIGVLIRSSEWYHVLSVALLLFANYYTLFKLSRDYRVAWRVYKMEQASHEKNTG